ncbi:hypothetical protein LguiB_019888 [Lonicera macranthoides]
MNMSTSECSSGCESGWTMYLDQSSNSENNRYPRSGEDYYRSREENVGEDEEEEEEEEENEDLSMVSDASSGPRHFLEDEVNGYFSYAPLPSENTKSTKNKEIKERRGKKQSSYLDDTASSPVLGFSKKNVGLSNDQASMEHDTQGFSATHFKEKSALRKHFGLKKPSVPGSGASGKSGGLQGRKRQ